MNKFILSKKMKIWKYITSLCISLLFCTSMAFAQQGITVSGTVTDKDGTLPGVNVTVKGTIIGVVTDVNGKYQITVPNADAVLVFSFVGYNTTEMLVGAQREINVNLTENAEQIGEVVIMAEFGVARVARSVGSSVQNVKASDVIESGRDNFITALQGRVSGMNVVSSGGAPGASTTVTLRSMTSLSGNNQPLYVVDGVPMNNSSFNPALGAGFVGTDTYATRNLDFSSRGNDFNPEDIEAITVLKGAAAAALYGSDASNGAIIITTRKGQAGAGKVSYSNSFRWDNAYGLPEMQTKYGNGAYGVTNYYNAAMFGGPYADGTKFYDNLSAMLQTGFTSRHNLSVEGGNEKLTLRATASLTDQTGVIRTTDYKRQNISLSGKSQVNSWFGIESSIQYAGTTNNKVKKGYMGPMYYAMHWPVYDDMSNWLHGDGIHMRYPVRYLDSDLWNPLFMMHRNKYLDVTDRVIGNVTAIITPIKSVFFRAQYGWDIGAQTFETSEHPYWADNNQTRAPGIGGVYNLAKANFADKNLNFLLGWQDNLLDDKLNLQVQFGYHQIENANADLATNGRNYAVVDLVSINNCDPTTVVSGKHVAKRRLQALSGQVMIGYSNIAFLTLRGRNDWSSTLPKDNNKYFYPAAELSFVASELPYFKGISVSEIVSYFKIRGAIAQVGKDASPLAINPELIPTQRLGGGYKYDFTGPNLALKPEMTTSTEIGFDARFLDNRINVDFTRFNTYCKDQIVSGFRMSYASGFVLNTRNMGEFKTWGWEAHIDGDIYRTRDWTWNLGVNMSHTDSKVTKLPVAGYYDAYSWIIGNIRTGALVGEPVTVLVGDKIMQNEAGQKLVDPTSGAYVTDDTQLWRLGDREPKVRYGINTRVRYKGWNLSAMAAGKLGATIFNGTKERMFQRGTSWESVTAREAGPFVLDGVLRDGLHNTDNPTVNTIAITAGHYTTTIYGGHETQWINTKINYLRLQEIRLSYTVPNQMLRNITGGFLSYANVYVTGNDLFTVTNYSGLDAVGNVMSASAGGVGGEGFDYWSLPNPRGFTVGLSVTF